MTTEEERRPRLTDLESALARGPEVLRSFVGEIHPADLAELLEDVSERDALRVFQELGTEGRSQLLQFATEELREGLLEKVDLRQLTDIVEELPADEAVDLLALVDDVRSEQVLSSVDFERAQGLRELASYDAETAGGLMTTDFVSVPQGIHVGDAIKELRSEEGPAGEEEIGIFVVDPTGAPVGFVSDRELLTTQIHTPIDQVMETELITVRADADQEEVANLVSKYSLAAVGVVDSAGRLIGVVSAEDAQDVLEEELEEDLRRIVGTSPREQTKLSVMSRVRTRLPLQALTVVGGLVTAWILDRALPESSLGETVDILRYLPIIIGLAGNVGIQSATILVRAIATGEISHERETAVIGPEVLVGTLIGLICGATTMVVAAAMEGTAAGPDFTFGLAVGAAIAVAVMWAAFLGCAVPLSCQRLKIDPAIVSGPFLITLSDISGAAIFVLVARLALQKGT